MQSVFAVGSIRYVRVLKRSGVGPGGGRALTIEAVGSKGKRVLTADQVRIRLHLKSGWISFPARSLDMPTNVAEAPGR
jgi:stage II sporulation protein D